MRFLFSVHLIIIVIWCVKAQQPYSDDYKLFMDSSISKKVLKDKRSWSNPKKATIFALALPGSGQIYNEKYLKAGIVYGGFVGLAYMYDFNRDSLSKYQTIYAAKIDGDTNTIDLYPNRSEESRIN